MNTDKVFIYWDNSNIFYAARRLAEEREYGPSARTRIRVNFDNLMQLAHAGRPVARAVAAGSVPPEMRHLWNRMERQDVKVHLFNRGAFDSPEQQVPDVMLREQMLMDGFDNNGNPGIVVLLTGDGAGYSEGVGFHSVLERLHNRGWKIEILSWEHVCNKRMQQWAIEHGVFVALDDFYESVTFLEPSQPGHELAHGRESAPLDLNRRNIA